MIEAAFLTITFVIGVGTGGIFMHTLMIGRYADGFSAGYVSGKDAGRIEGLTERRDAVHLLETEEQANG